MNFNPKDFYYSSSKQRWFYIPGMRRCHLENALKKYLNEHADAVPSADQMRVAYDHHLEHKVCADVAKEATKHIRETDEYEYEARIQGLQQRVKDLEQERDQFERRAEAFMDGINRAVSVMTKEQAQRYAELTVQDYADVYSE